jgi:hypothetical protein
MATMDVSADDKGVGVNIRGKSLEYAAVSEGDFLADVLERIEAISSIEQNGPSTLICNGMAALAQSVFFEPAQRLLRVWLPTRWREPARAGRRPCGP